MANPVLGKLQGQGLIETTTSGLEQAGAQLAVTPVGAAMQGRGPDSQKMAGTKPAKVNAAAANMRDVTSAALGTLRETSRVVEGQQDEIAAVAANADPLARADKAISSAAQSIINSTFASFKWEGANLDATKLKNAGFKDTDIADLSTSLAELIAGGPIKLADGSMSDGLTQADVNKINDALEKTGGTKISLYDKEQPVSAYTLATSLSTLYADDSSTSLPKILANAIKDAESSTQISNLNLTTLNTILGKEYTPDQLEQARAEFVAMVKTVTGLSETEIGQLNFRSLRAAIDKWQKDEFKDVADLRATLTDPTASKAQQQLALQELRRLGQIGVTGAEAKVNDIQAQMDDEDTIKLGNEEFTVEELFSDPAKLMQFQTWVDNPETAPPEIKTWLEQNKNGIQLQIQKLMGEGSAGIFGAVAAIQGVANSLKTDPSVGGVAENVMENFFPEFAELTLDTKIPVDPATLPATATAADKKSVQESWDNYQKYKLLQPPTTGQPNTAIAANNLYNGLLTIPGVDGKAIFKELSVAQMTELVSSGTSVSRFLDGLKHRVNASNFKGDPANMSLFKGAFIDLADDLGFLTTGKQLTNLFDVDLKAYAEIFTKAGLGDWLSNGKFNVDKLQGLINDVKSMSTADLLAGKNRTIIDSLSNLVTKLTAAAGEIPEKSLGTMSERDAQFRKEKNIETPEAILERNTTEMNKNQTLANDYARDWIRSDRDLKAAEADIAEFTKKRPPVPQKDRYGQVNPEQQAAWDAFNQEYNKKILRRNDIFNNWSWLQTQAENYKNTAQSYRDVVNDYTNNMTSKKQAYRDQYDTWWAGYETKIAQENADTRNTYNTFSKLIGGLL